MSEGEGRCPNCGEDEMDGGRCYYCGFHDYDCGMCEECAGKSDDRTDKSPQGEIEGI